jgi:hypothetical protein
MLWGRRRLVQVIQSGDGPTIEGVLVHKSLDCYRLRAAKLLVETDDEHQVQTRPLDGEIEIPRERVLFVQLLARSG